MYPQFAYAKLTGLVMGVCLSSSLVSAAVQTTPYIAVHIKPQYSNLQAMPYANARAPKGGMISSAASGTFDNLNSMNGQGNSVEGVNYLFDRLMDPSLDEPGVFYPLLAERVSFDPEHSKFIIFHLNPKAKFSNGTSLTAEDVKFTFQSYLTKANLGLQMYLSDLGQIEVLSKYSIKMSFKSGKNNEMPLILAQMPIYSKLDWKNKDFSKVTMQPILGSGPYLIDRIDAGRSITYKRNPHYWAQDLAINRGRYNFDKIKYVYYRNPDIAFEGFKSGQFTFHQEKKSKNWVEGYGFPAIKAGVVKKYISKTQRPSITSSIVMNTRKPPFSDIQFRQALSYAYDFEWLNKAMFYGQYQRLQSHFQFSELEAKGSPSPAEQKILNTYLAKLHLIQRQAVMQNWKYPVSDGSGFNRQGLLRARSILLKAGYRYRNGVLLDHQNQPIKINFLLRPEDLPRSLMPYVRNLKKLGITVDIRQVDSPQYIERMRRSDFDMTPMDMPQSLIPSIEQTQMWGSQAADQVGNYNYSGIKSAVVDDAIQQLIRAPNREQLILRTKILDRLLRSGYYQILTFGNNQTWFAYWNMYQQPTIKPKLSLGLDYWWVDQKQAQNVVQYLGRK